MIRVLVVDDSAFVRKTIAAILGRSPRLEVVGFAGDGEEALEQVLRLRPDVVTVDLEMPVMNGVQFIEAQMGRAPLPIVVVSAVDPDGSLAGASMRAGAAEFVLKPTHLADQRLTQIENDLLEKVHAVAEIAGESLLDETMPSSADSSPCTLPKATPGAVVIGLSTGGPQILHALMRRMPEGFPLPVAVVIHMPIGFTGPLAERLDQNSALEVLEASPGLEMKPGRCIVARAGLHLVLHPDGTGGVLANTSLSPADSPYRPSVNQLFQSASRCYKERLVALVLTGMGSDGREGAAWVKANGGQVYTQTRESCAVWGMPRAVVESGLSDGDLSPAEIVPFLARLAES